MNIGIIGIGNSGTAHLTAYKNLKNSRVTSVYDIDKDKLEKAEKIIPGCRAYSSLEDFLGSDI